MISANLSINILHYYMNSRHYRYYEKVELHLKKKQIIERPVNSWVWLKYCILKNFGGGLL